MLNMKRQMIWAINSLNFGDPALPWVIGSFSDLRQETVCHKWQVNTDFSFVVFSIMDLSLWNHMTLNYLTPPNDKPLLYIEGILPKGLYLPCVSMAGRAFLAGYHRYTHTYARIYLNTVIIVPADGLAPSGAPPISTKFWIPYGSVTVMVCTKFHCDQLNTLWTRPSPSFIEYRIEGFKVKYCYWDRCHNMPYWSFHHQNLAEDQVTCPMTLMAINKTGLKKCYFGDNPINQNTDDSPTGLQRK